MLAQGSILIIPHLDRVGPQLFGHPWSGVSRQVLCNELQSGHETTFQTAKTITVITLA
jgi:hypothetical protein